MSKEMAVIVLGVWIVVLPYLGIPGSWRTTILIFSGLLIAIIGFFLRAEVLARGARSAHHPFVENIPIKDTSAHAAEGNHDRTEGIHSLN